MARYAFAAEVACLDVGKDRVVGDLHEAGVLVSVLRPCDVLGDMLHILDRVHIDAYNLLEVRCHQIEEGNAVLSRSRVEQHRPVGDGCYFFDMNTEQLHCPSPPLFLDDAAAHLAVDSRTLCSGCC